MKSITKASMLLILSVLFVNRAMAQSADSRICNCFTKEVSADFMLASKAFYGGIGVVLRRNDELKPRESQLVKFSIPKLEPKQGCGSVYSIYITDQANNTIHESEDSHNEFTYSFRDCSKTYTVKLTAYSKSPAGRDGNCSRSISFKVKPQCNTTVCNCADNTKAGTSADFNLDGKVTCLPSSANFRRYTIRYKIINKTGCNLYIESITMLGTSFGSSTEPVLARASSITFDMGFSTPLTTAAPSGGKVTASVRYNLNGKKCSALMDLPYEACR